MARHFSKVGPRCPYPKYERIAASGELVGHRPGFPVEQPARLGGGADRHREAARVRAQDAVHALHLQFLHPAGRVRLGRQILREQRDRHTVDPTVRVHQVSGDLHARILLLRQRRLASG